VNELDRLRKENEELRQKNAGLESELKDLAILYRMVRASNEKRFRNPRLLDQMDEIPLGQKHG
jgi:hypothetical protein